MIAIPSSIEDIETRRRLVGRSLASLCRAAGLDYFSCWRRLIAGTLDPDAVLRLDAELTRVETEIAAALAARQTG